LSEKLIDIAKLKGLPSKEIRGANLNYDVRLKYGRKYKEKIIYLLAMDTVACCFGGCHTVWLNL
jgi:hypothetical protein